MSLNSTQGCKTQIKAFALMHHVHAPTFTVVASICFTAAWFPWEALLSVNEYSPAVVKSPSLASQHRRWGGSHLSNWYFLLRLWCKNSGTRRKNRNKPHHKLNKQNTLFKLWDHFYILAAISLWSPVHNGYFQSWFPPFNPFFFLTLRIKAT